jgi:hypothetical protein
MKVRLIPEKYKEKEKNKSIKKTLKIGGTFFGGGFWFKFSIFLVLASILSCFGLWGYKISLSKEEEKIETEIADLESQRDLEMENKIIALNQKSQDLKEFLSERFYASRTLKMIEDLTLPLVQISDVNADIFTGLINLNLKTGSYKKLAEQIVAFKEDSRIDSINIQELSSNERLGEITSGLELSLNKEFLKGFSEESQ